MNRLLEQIGTPDPAERMLRQQVVDRGLRDPRLLEAMRTVRREKFFPEDLAADAHADRAAPIGHGQTISQPYIVALMTDRLSLAGTERVLEVGTGSGYQTAILAQLAAEVFTVERVKPLLDSAFERLHESGVTNIKFRHGDGSAGWPEVAPFDRILIAAVAPAVPRRLLLDQLADGGIAVLPVGTGDQQTLLRLTRRGGELVREDVCACRFVPLIGEEGFPK